MNPIIADDDLNIFFDIDEFAMPAKFCPDGQPCRDVKVHLFLEDAIDTVYYMVYARMSDLHDVSVGDRLVLDGTDYAVTGITPDEFGLTLAITVNKDS